MKKALSILLLYSLSALAIEVKFMDPCQDNFIMKTDVKEFEGSAGELTIHVLNKFQVPHQGDDKILHSVFSTPTGDKAVERISEAVTRFYGWCYVVDGISPDVYPSEVHLGPENKSLVWYFGYAELNRGEWTEQCAPSSKIKPKFLCPVD